MDKKAFNIVYSRLCRKYPLKSKREIASMTIKAIKGKGKK